jgi:hypothetical protein
MSKQRVTEFSVDYWHGKLGGSQARAQMTTSMRQISVAQRETAVLAHLRKIHRGDDITIMTLEWR